MLSAARRMGEEECICRQAGLTSDDCGVWENVNREMRRRAAMVSVDGRTLSREEIGVRGKGHVLDGIENVAPYTLSRSHSLGKGTGVFWGKWGVEEVEM